MPDITIRAAYATVAEDEGDRFIGFVEADEEGYALFRQPVGGGAVWFELNDDDLGAEDAVEAIRRTPKGIEITLRPALRSRFGWAGSVAIRLDACDGAGPALKALGAMLPPDLWQTAAAG